MKRLFLLCPFLTVFLTGYVAHADVSMAYSAPVLLRESTASFSGPADMALMPDGSFLLVADAGNHEIKVLQPGTLKLVSQFGQGTLDGPTRVDFTQSGQLRVVDRDFTRITLYQFEGVFRDGRAAVKQLEVQTVTDKLPPVPGTVTDTNGLVFVVNTAENHILILDPDSNRISAYGSDHLNAPRAVETVGRYFWIADTGNNRILLLKAPQARKK